MSVIEENWENIFGKYKVLEKINDNGFFIISSTEINKYHEARLMTKFDHKTNLPQQFIKNNISILPLTRGSYILGNFNTYQDLFYDSTIENTSFSLPEHIESIDYNNLYSENSALHCAYVCRIIDDVLGEDVLPTVSGRMSTGSFDFNIKNILHGNTYPISVVNSQCEIDGGYESLTKMVIIEAKNFSSDDFLIRQLYYPYRLWQGKIQKQVIPIFMTYSNDIFSFFTYRFNNLLEYNSLEIVSQKNYIIAPEQITLDDIYSVLQTVLIVQEPEIPFPQADTFKRVIDLLGLLMDNDELTAEYITLNYAFDKRQTSYYTNAGMYLGLICKKRNVNITYSLTETGKKIMSKRHKQKYLSLVEIILKHEVFNKVLREYFAIASPVPKVRIIEIMNGCFLYNVETQSTVDRRAQTVAKWIDWILKLQDI
jgi:hypothetical protein